MKISEIINRTLQESSLDPNHKTDNSGPKIYYLSINGKLWTKEDGTPLQLRGKAHATAIANKVKAQDPNKIIRISTSAVDPKLIAEDAYDEAERILHDAKAAKENGDMGDFYTLMADYHDLLAQWHESKGRYQASARHAKEVEKFHNAAIAHSTKMDFE